MTNSCIVTSKYLGFKLLVPFACNIPLQNTQLEATWQSRRATYGGREVEDNAIRDGV